MIQNSNEDVFDDYDEFVVENIPDAGKFLEGHDLLTGRRHLEFHKLTRDIFESRGVYDMTFGYNLARLNLDSRFPGAGFRYAEETESDGNQKILRAEFTPTTEFCPQSNTLTIGSFRAWNLSQSHDYDLIRIRVSRIHNEHEAINDELKKLEDEYRDKGELKLPTHNNDK